MFEPHGRFLLRASIAIITLSAIWWFLLLTPLLFAFRITVNFLGPVVFRRAACELMAEADSHDWHFCVPVNVVVPNRGGAGFSKLTEIEFDMPRSDLFIFTFGLPVYWALALAMARKGRWLRHLLAGTALTACAEIILLLLFLATFAHGVNPARGGATNWFLRFSQYLEVNALPDLVPFLVAFVVHRDLRLQVLGWASGMKVPEKIKSPPRRAGLSSRRRSASAAEPPWPPARG